MFQKLKIIYYFIYFRYIKKKYTVTELAEHQAYSLKNILKFVSEKSEFYQKIFNTKALNIQACPIMDKSIMVENFDTINTVGLSKEKIFEKVIEGEKIRDFSPSINGNVIGLSSGTSGHRGLYCVAPQEQAKHAGFLLAKQIPNVFQKNTIAYFQRNDSNLYSKGKSRVLQFQFFDLVFSLEEHLDELNKFNPTVLVGPGSILKRLAVFQKEGRLNISPERIIASVEVLDPIDEKIIKECFDHDVIHQVYICTEGFLGTTCDYGTIHLNEELVYFEKEYLDSKQDKFIPILTDLNRKGQPHIRYRLNDILVLAKSPCPCGDARLAISEIMGRSDDTFYLRKESNDELVEVFPDFIRRPIVYVDRDILDYLVIQESPEVMKINLNIELIDKKEIEEEISQSFFEMFTYMKLKVPKIEYTYNENKLKLRKMRRIQRVFQVNK